MLESISRHNRKVGGQHWRNRKIRYYCIIRSPARGYLFVPITPGEVGLYTCGPTVYNFQHIGNFKTFIFEDTLVRMLRYNGYDVDHVMNITDVGHLTSDADEGRGQDDQGHEA